MSSEKNRRFFIRQLLSTMVGAAALSSGLVGCSTLDEYLFEDHYDLKDQVLIIGGGLSGLYMASLLKQSKTEFRLLEGSKRFGGRIRSSQNYDLGASVFSSEDRLMNKLVKDFLLTAESLDKKNIFVSSGLESLVTALVDRTSGLMPYRNLRLQWRLTSIKKINNTFELLFATPRGRRTFVSQRVVLALPPSQWAGITGLLELEEMKDAREWLKSLKTENIVKVVFPYTSSQRPVAGTKSILSFQDSLFDVRQVNKKAKNLYWSEVDFRFSESGQSLEIEKMNDFMKRKMGLSVNFNRLTTENYFDWKKIELIGAAQFTNALSWPSLNSPHFQIIGDYATTQSPYKLEGALNSALTASEKIL